MDAIWLVVGDTGEYSDHTTWNVAAYPEKEVAEQHAKLANEWLKEKNIHKDDGGGDWEARDEVNKEHLNPYDQSGVALNYNGGRYFVEEVSVFLHVDDYRERTEIKKLVEGEE